MFDRVFCFAAYFRLFLYTILLYNKFNYMYENAGIYLLLKMGRVESMGSSVIGTPSYALQ